MAYEFILTERFDGVAVVTLNRPEKLNALSFPLVRELDEALTRYEADADIKAVVLTGTGDRAFSAGADVTDLPEMWRAVPTVGFTTDKPIIAATTGWVIGGAIVMVMMCDLMVSTESTQFYYPEAKLGTTAGGISSLVSRMPHKLAMEIMLLGSKVLAALVAEWNHTIEVMHLILYGEKQ